MRLPGMFVFIAGPARELHAMDEYKRHSMATIGIRACAVGTD